MIRTHDGSHGDSCFGCRIATISFGAAAMPTRRPHTNQMNATEKQWAKDHPAYKAMRRNGVHPRSTVGAHDLMQRASTREEVEGLPKLWRHTDEILQPISEVIE
jgi:hypothetical protein